MTDRVLVSVRDIVIDDFTHTVKRNGRSIQLTPREYELLRFLALNPERVFSKQEIFQEVWGWEYFGGDGTLRYHVSEIRRKIGQDIIESVRKYGYRLCS